MLSTLSSAFDMLLVILGFGFVILIHELGHFLAARWAGIRVHAFAIGFGPAICSYRKGLGFRMGSSEQELARRYGEKRVTSLDDAGAVIGEDIETEPRVPDTISPTEYRLNWLPFGGYVKMLGQDDMDPRGASKKSAPDSFMAKTVPQRMVVISAGVIMNVILAAILFVIVFMVGLKQEAPVVGYIAPGSPAASAQTATPGVEPGLRTGDRIVSINGGATPSFQYVATNVAMARAHKPLTMVVEREGVDEAMVFTATPRVGAQTRLLEVGLAPAFSTTLARVSEYAPDIRSLVRNERDANGLGDIPEGSVLLRVDGVDAASPDAISRAARQTGGAPVVATFRLPGGAERDATIIPSARFPEVGVQPDNGGPPRATPHVLGFTPPMRVLDPGVRGGAAGLRAGDVFARIGPTDWPDIASGVNAIRAASGSAIDLVVLRDGAFVTLRAPVSREGSIGFSIAPATETKILAATAPGARPGTRLAPVERVEGQPEPAQPVFAARSLNLPPGAVLESIDARPIASFVDIHRALADARERSEGETITLSLVVRLPLGASFGEGPTETHEWTVSRADLAQAGALSWASSINEFHFEPLMVTRKAGNPISAMAMGVQETHRVMMSAYLTIARLFQGSVKVEHLKGPVGIAHIGAVVAKRGIIDLIFFMAIISVNLAVLNFLPLPIVDGGLFVFLLWEGITGKPVSPTVQGATAMIGLLLIGALFLLVTFNDITNLFGGG
ncbi:MAG: site-2 protease family protein [Phycisphaeraceae bacterium]|nr:site-2 protease family protein [Phycisphaeraceae bacterium]